jgi:dTDP-4-dehydrorhamnose 3,5-epimerase-like enzyme
MELKKNALDGINKFEKTRFGDKRGFFSIAFFGFKMFKSLKKKKKKKIV